MKKIIIAAILSLLVVLGVVVISLNLSFKNDAITTNYEELQKKIINNFEWLTLSDTDMNGYLAKTYTPSIKKIISSLEEAIPVIFQVSKSKFTPASENTFITVSGFNESNDVYVYYYDSSIKKYLKTTSSLASVLENATNAFVCSDLEVLK